MKRFVILAVMFVIAFSCSAETVADALAETGIDSSPTVEQKIEYNEDLVKYYEAMREYNLEYHKWQTNCRNIDEKYYKTMAKYYKTRAKYYKAKDAKDNAPTRKERLYANDRYKSLSKKLPKYPKKPEYPEAPKRPEYPKPEY